MKVFHLTTDSNNRLFVCGEEQAAVDWELAKGRRVLGKIETDLDILELREFIGGSERRV